MLAGKPLRDSVGDPGRWRENHRRCVEEAGNSGIKRGIVIGMSEKKPKTRGRRRPEEWELRASAVERQRSDVIRRLQHKIREKGFTQRRVERVLGWGETYVSSLVTGKIRMSVDHLLAICDVIDVHPGELFAGIVRPLDEAVEQVLVKLLRTCAHPRDALGEVSESALIAAAEKRVRRARGIKRQYLRDLILWCQSSIELEHRAAQRRAPDKGAALPGQRIVFPSFRKYQKAARPVDC